MLVIAPDVKTMSNQFEKSKSERKALFASLLKQLTVNHPWTQAQIAEHLGYSPRVYSRFVSPTDNRWPSADRLPDFANFFKVSISDFYDPINTSIDRSAYERRLIAALRRSAINHRHLPIEMITSSIMMVFTSLSNEDRELWLYLGHQLVKAKK